MVKAIIFDLDGTLLNTLPDIHYVLNYSLKNFGLGEISIEKTKQFIGNGAKNLVRCAVSDERPELTEKIYRYYSEKFSECDNRFTKLYKDEEEILFALKSMGVKLAIVTNKPQRATDNVYNKFLKKFDFNEVLGQTEYRELKPNPSSTIEIIDKFNVKKDECIFVGDGETDVLTAKAAGIKCISVLWGYRNKQQLEAVGSTVFADCFKHFFELINSKNY